MWKKLILTFMLTSAFCMGLSITASAEETELIPSDDWVYTTYFEESVGNVQTYITTDSMLLTPSDNPTPSQWLAGNYLSSGAARIAYKDPYLSGNEIGGLSLAQRPYGMNYYYDKASTNNTPTCPTFNLTLQESTITLDVSNLLPGWYRYEADLYIGVAMAINNNYTGSYVTVNPQFTYDTSVFPIAGGGTIQYVGTETVNAGFLENLPIYTQLLHFHFVDTWEVNPEVEEYTWNVGSAFPYLVSTLNYDASGITMNKYRHFLVLTNNRFVSALYGNVEPLVTPTPLPTPYPGQDTQESINQGVDQIESQVAQIGQILDVQATPVPYPYEMTIDETLMDEIESMTLPDISTTQPTISDMWSIFTPIVWFLAIFASAIFVTSVFCFLLRGGWI